MFEKKYAGTLPLISILMPVKNTCPFLVDCINSIISQNYTHWELIAIDDNSTDISREILEDFAKKDKRISWAGNSGNGIIEALRQALSLSNGLLITRMDSDDLMEESKLFTMAQQLMERGKGHIAIGLVQYFSDDGLLGNGYKRYETWLNKLSAVGRNYSEIYKECVIPSPCWMVFKEDLEKCGDFNMEIYPEDYDLCFRFYKNNLQIIPTTKFLHFWRDHSKRTSRTHPNYSDNRFLELKVKHFLDIEINKSKRLVLWGAGKKGKEIAKILLSQNIAFIWVTNNRKKIGLVINNKIVNDENILNSSSDYQYIIAVANPEEQITIKSKIGNTEYYFFC